MDMNRRKLILEGPIYKGLMIVAFPLMINNLMRTLYNFADMFFVSKLGSINVAAISLVWPIIMLMINFGIGLQTAATTFIGQAIGANDEEKAKDLANKIFIMSAALSIVVTILGFVFSPSIVRLMTDVSELQELSTTYLRVILLQTPIVFLFGIYQGVMQGRGNTSTPMKFIGISVILNIILDPIFIFTFNLNIFGAGLATLISRYTVYTIAIAGLFKRKEIDIKPHHFDFQEFKRIFTTALPLSLGSMFNSIGFAVLNTFIVGFGVEVMTAFSVGNRISSIFMMPVLGIGSAITTFISQAYGNKDRKRMRQAYIHSNIITAVFMLISTVVLILNREAFTSLFIDKTLEPDTFNLTYVYMFYVALNFVFMGILQNIFGAVSGMAKTKYVMLFGVMRLWMLRIPIILIGKHLFDMNEQIIWHAMYMSNIIVNIFGITVVYRLLFIKNTQRDPKVKSIINDVIDSAKTRNVASVYLHGDILYDEVCIEPTLNLVIDSDKDQELIDDIVKRVDAVHIDETDVNVFVKTNTGYKLMLNFDHKHPRPEDGVAVYEK